MWFVLCLLLINTYLFEVVRTPCSVQKWVNYLISTREELHTDLKQLHILLNFIMQCQLATPVTTQS